ncbi:MAG: sugar phosphate isomerase/epimerase family protein [bacterium]
MKKGINTWCFAAGSTLADQFRLAKEAGFETIELALNETGELSLHTTKAQALALTKTAEKAGIEIGSLAGGIYWDYPFTSPDPKIRTKAKTILKKQLQVASWLGTDATLVVVGNLAKGIGGPPVVSYERAYDIALKTVKECARDAEKHKVCIGVENVWSKMLQMPYEIRDFVDAVGSEYVRVYFDVGNCLLVGYPEHYIPVLGNRIHRVHIKDFNCAVGNINGFVPLLAGDVNYPAVIEELKKIKYEGPLTVEVGPCKHHPTAGLYLSSLALDFILGRK